jgi:hypothetical protein
MTKGSKINDEHLRQDGLDAPHPSITSHRFIQYLAPLDLLWTIPSVRHFRSSLQELCRH